MSPAEPREDDLFIGSSASFDSNQINNSGSVKEDMFTAAGLDIFKLSLEPNSAWELNEYLNENIYAYVVAGELELNPTKTSEKLKVTSGSFWRSNYEYINEIHADSSNSVEILFGVYSQDNGEAIDGVDIVKPNELKDTNSLKNVNREKPFLDSDIHLVRGHTEEKMASEWHDHGENKVFGYITHGTVFAELGLEENNNKFVELSEGDLFYWPEKLLHRERNLNPGKVDYVLWMIGEEPRMRKNEIE